MGTSAPCGFIVECQELLQAYVVDTQSGWTTANLYAQHPDNWSVISTVKHHNAIE